MKIFFASLLLCCLFLLLLTIGGWLYLRHVEHGFSARAQPTRVESMLANEARRAATTNAVRDRTNPLAASNGAIHDGMAHFADHCAICHANSGSGDTMLGNGMYPKPPDLRLAATQNQTDGELFHVIEDGIRLSGMPAFGGNGSSEDESWKLVVFLRHLPKLTPAEEQTMQGLNPKSPEERKEEEEEQNFLNGSDGTLPGAASH